MKTLDVAGPMIELERLVAVVKDELRILEDRLIAEPSRELCP